MNLKVIKTNSHKLTSLYTSWGSISDQSLSDICLKTTKTKEKQKKFKKSTKFCKRTVSKRKSLNYTEKRVQRCLQSCVPFSTMPFLQLDLSIIIIRQGYKIILQKCNYARKFKT